MKTQRTSGHGWLSVVLLSLALGLVLGWFLVVLLGIGSSPLCTLLRHGASTRVKLFANALVASVTAMCLWVLLRSSFEDVGILKKRDRWVDWRHSPSPELLDGPAVMDVPRGSSHTGTVLPIPVWPSRIPLRAQHNPGAKTYSGFNRRHPN